MGGTECVTVGTSPLAINRLGLCVQEEKKPRSKRRELIAWFKQESTALRSSMSSLRSRMIRTDPPAQAPPALLLLSALGRRGVPLASWRRSCTGGIGSWPAGGPTTSTSRRSVARASARIPVWRQLQPADASSLGARMPVPLRVGGFTRSCGAPGSGHPAPTSANPVIPVGSRFPSGPVRREPG